MPQPPPGNGQTVDQGSGDGDNNWDTEEDYDDYAFRGSGDHEYYDDAEGDEPVELPIHEGQSYYKKKKRKGKNPIR